MTTSKPNPDIEIFLKVGRNRNDAAMEMLEEFAIDDAVYNILERVTMAIDSLILSIDRLDHRTRNE